MSWSTVTGGLATSLTGSNTTKLGVTLGAIQKNDLIVVHGTRGTGASNDAASDTLVDTISSSYTQSVVAWQSTNLQVGELWYAIAPSAGSPSLTWTFPSHSFDAMTVEVYRSTAGAPTLDTSASFQGSTANANPDDASVGPITTAAASELVASGFQNTSGAAAVSAGTGQTSDQATAGTGGNQIFQHLVQANAGSVTPTASMGGSAVGYTAVTAAFKEAAASVAAFLVYGHTGLDRIASIEAWLKTNVAGWLPFTATGLDRLANIEAFLAANNVNSVTFLPYGKTGTDRLWNIESYLLSATGSSG